MLSNREGSNRTYRISTNVDSGEGGDKFVNINLDRDSAIVEMLSLKIDTTNFYKLHTSNYGCIAGRVLANGGVGVPNVKVSVFIAADDSEDDPVLRELYPFANSFSRDGDNVKYNLLPDTQVTVCHTPIGRFPSKRMVLDDDRMNVVFDRYYRYTTRTNNSGDYMLFGIPVGEQIVHSDVDLSDIGFLSQKPRDMIYKGYDINQFENANKFKSDTNIENLVQVVTQDDPVTVYPFWGDESEDTIKITRNDININYKFEPTCVFLGSLITDEKSNGIGKNCIPTERMGKMDRLTTGSGTIEMIRKKPDGSVEEFSIMGNQLIDGNGTWCYQIPMNLDYYMTDEYGNLVPSDNNEKGIPTRARVRFRVSLNDFQSDYENNHLSKLLIPNNPKEYEDLDYHFGTMTMDSNDGSKSFRDLFWNNVYSVKSYIPRIQKGASQRNKKFSGIKQVNVNGSNNPIPYNNMRVNLTFMFVLQCAIIKMLIRITGFINNIKEEISSDKVCSVVGDGVCPDLENWYFAPSCNDDHLKTTLDVIEMDIDSKSIEENNRDIESKRNVCVTNKIDYLFQCIEVNLAMEYDVIQFDFYNDWMNGVVYIPRWFVNKKKKRSYLFGLIRIPAKTESCMESTFNMWRRYVQQCSLAYALDERTNTYTKVTTTNGCDSNLSKQKCHKGGGRDYISVFRNLGGGGLIHDEQTLSGQNVYYVRPAEWMEANAGSGYKRCVLFATDIILLGSLNEYDENGIPNAFKELSSSSFKMPPNLAATNMDSTGFMFGIGDNGARCTGTKYLNKPLEKIDQTFENYREWSKRTDYVDKIPDDINESPVTEMSGIDWGYYGPNQDGNDLEKLYFPGGHFLGISCLNSEVNIKSCVNLSRVCEIGTSMSQRQAIPDKKGDDDISYTHIIPTGLVNKYDITDSGFRKMFATMNANGLRTKVNMETGYKEYDFKVLLPTAFNGELEDKVSNDGYNSTVIREVTVGGVISNAYRSTIESTSYDYYRFRMGEPDEKEGYINKYMGRTGSSVYLPMYDNSYYFYFGLRDGETAIDRFFKDFYAPCRTNDEDTGFFTVETTDTEYCDTTGGTASVIINGVASPYTIELGDLYLKIEIDESQNVTINVSEEKKSGYLSYIVHNYARFTFTGLSEGTYELRMYSDEEGLVTYKFHIGKILPESITNLTIDGTDFVSGVTYYNYANQVYYDRPVSNLPNEGGYVDISNVITDKEVIGLVLFNSEYYVPFGFGNYDEKAIAQIFQKIGYGMSMDCIDDYGPEWDISGGSTRIPVWKGNDTYTLLAFTCCEGCTGLKFDKISYVIVDSVFVRMNTSLDLYFCDEDVSYQSLKRKYMSLNFTDEGWPYQVLSLTQKSSIHDSWCLKHALFYRYSMFDGQPYGDLNVHPFNGSTPYNEYIEGKAERYSGYGSQAFLFFGGNRDVPTVNVLEGKNVYDDPEENEDKKSYTLDIHRFYLPTHACTCYDESQNYFHELVPSDFDGYNLVFYFKGFHYPNFIPDALSMEFDIVSHTFHYSYSLTDSNGVVLSPTPIEIPSIYKPFYFNAVGRQIYRCDKSGNVLNPLESYRIHYDIVICNLIPYGDDKYGTITVNGNKIMENGVPIGINTPVVLSSDSSSGDYIFRVSGTIDMSGTDDPSIMMLDITVTEPSPPGYEGSAEIMTISETARASFPVKESEVSTKGTMYITLDDGGGRSKQEAAERYMWAELLDKYHWEDVDGAHYYNGMFGNSDLELHRATEEIEDALKSHRWTDFVDKIVELNDNDQYYHLIAMKDPWTPSGVPPERGEWEYVNEYVTPDTTTVGLARLYLIKS